MGSKALAIKFEKTDKRKIKGKVGHSRTGACTCAAYRQCFHGKKASLSPSKGKKH